MMRPSLAALGVGLAVAAAAAFGACGEGAVDNSGQGILCADAERLMIQMCDRWQTCGIGGYATADACVADQLDATGVSTWRQDAVEAYAGCFATTCNANVLQCLAGVKATPAHVAFETECKNVLAGCGATIADQNKLCDADTTDGIPQRVLASDVIAAHQACLEDMGCAYQACWDAYDASRACRPAP